MNHAPPVFNHVFVQMWPRQSFPCSLFSLRSGYFLSIVTTSVTSSYITQCKKKKHPRIVLFLSWVMVLVKCDQDTNNWFVLNISCCRVEHRYMWKWPSYLKYYELQTWQFDSTFGNFKSRIYSCGKWKRSFVGFYKSMKIHINIWLWINITS